LPSTRVSTRFTTHYRNNYECKKLYGPRPQVSTRFRLDWARTLLDKGEVNQIENTLACYKNNYDCKTLYDSGLGLQKGLDTL
jgi:hypothetical protein